jgi:hypothetical protein
MTIICSWCRGEGHTGVVGEKAPLDDRRETHGICLVHRHAVQARWKALVASERGEPSLVSVTVAQDRSAEESEGPPAPSRRHLWSVLRNLTRKAGW